MASPDVSLIPVPLELAPESFVQERHHMAAAIMPMAGIKVVQNTLASTPSADIIDRLSQMPTESLLCGVGVLIGAPVTLYGLFKLGQHLGFIARAGKTGNDYTLENPVVLHNPLEGLGSANNPKQRRADELFRQHSSASSKSNHDTDS